MTKADVPTIDLDRLQASDDDTRRNGRTWRRLDAVVQLTYLDNPLIVYTCGDRRRASNAMREALAFFRVAGLGILEVSYAALEIKCNNAAGDVVRVRFLSRELPERLEGLDCPIVEDD